MRISILPRWHGKFLVSVINAYHNHEPTIATAIFPENRTLNDDEYILFRSLIATNISDNKICQVMRNRYPTCVLLPQDVQNLKRKVKKESLDGKSEIHYLAEYVKDLSWKTLWRVDDSNNIIGLLMIPTTSQLLLQLFNVVLIIDATYKTNVCDYPLVQGIGITNTWLSFNAFFCFMSGEKEDDYCWLMTGLKRLLGEDVIPPVFAVDRDLALINSIKCTFPTCRIVLCICMHSSLII
jgi:hypothetical protein